MSRRKILLPFVVLVGILALSTSSSSGQETQTGLNVKELVRDAYRNGVEMSRRIFQYTWTDTRRYRLVERSGKVKSYPEQVYEVFPNRVNGKFLLRRLVKENGVPLSGERAAKEVARLARELEKDERDAEKAAQNQTSKTSPAAKDGACVPEGYVTAYGANGGLIAFSISDFLCAGEFSNPRRGTVNGREAVILDFRPRADYKPPGKERQPVAGLHGRVWIDAADRVVSRLEAWPAQEVSPSAEPVLVYEQARLADGTWMHSLTRINTTRHAELFNRVTIEFQELFTDYKKFTSNVEDYQIGTPRK